MSRAHWTKKGDETFYGYKNHAKVCVNTKLITGYDTTTASVHDSRRASELMDCNDAEGETFWLDAGQGKRGIDQPRLQHRPPLPDQTLSSPMDYCMILQAKIY